MCVPFRLLSLFLSALLAVGAAQAQTTDIDDEEDEEPPSAAPDPRLPPPNLPALDLTVPLLYEMLLGEIALQRGSADLAAQTYAGLAKRTRDPRIARRAVEVANFARTPQYALEAAQAWHEADPASQQALQTLVGVLVGGRKVEEAEPYLAKLLASDGATAANVFLQLGRLLAGNPDKQANQRVVRSLAAKYPDLPQARLALAQAALAADDEAGALAETRRAAQLQPGWEAAAIFEAQVLQRKSPAQAGKALAGFLEQYPKAREARLSYARLLVSERRLPEARAEFEKLLDAHPNNSDVIFAVGLLAAS